MAGSFIHQNGVLFQGDHFFYSFDSFPAPDPARPLVSLPALVHVIGWVPPGVSVLQQNRDLRFRTLLRTPVFKVDETVSSVAARPDINDGVVLIPLDSPAECQFGRLALKISYPGKPGN